jgi:hypothetical protein
MEKLKEEILESICDTIDYLGIYVDDDKKAKKEAEEEAEYDDDIDTNYENAVVDKCDENVLEMYEFLNRVEHLYLERVKPLLTECREQSYIPEAIRMREECFGKKEW